MGQIFLCVMMMYLIFSYLLIICHGLANKSNMIFVLSEIVICLEDELGKSSVKESSFHVTASINFCCLSVSHQ